jgi:hypothetical protein
MLPVTLTMPMSGFAAKLLADDRSVAADRLTTPAGTPASSKMRAQLEGVLFGVISLGFTTMALPIRVSPPSRQDVGKFQARSADDADGLPSNSCVVRPVAGDDLALDAASPFRGVVEVAAVPLTSPRAWSRVCPAPRTAPGQVLGIRRIPWRSVRILRSLDRGQLPRALGPVVAKSIASRASWTDRSGTSDTAAPVAGFSTVRLRALRVDEPTVHVVLK